MRIAAKQTTRLGLIAKAAIGRSPSKAHTHAHLSVGVVKCKGTDAHTRARALLNHLTMYLTRARAYLNYFHVAQTQNSFERSLLATTPLVTHSLGVVCLFLIEYLISRLSRGRLA